MTSVLNSPSLHDEALLTVTSPVGRLRYARTAGTAMRARSGASRQDDSRRPSQVQASGLGMTVEADEPYLARSPKHPWRTVSEPFTMTADW
jgi:hypothetical protein